jgi:hypothetical protein
MFAQRRLEQLASNRSTGEVCAAAGHGSGVVRPKKAAAFSHLSQGRESLQHGFALQPGNQFPGLASPGCCWERSY